MARMLHPLAGATLLIGLASPVAAIPYIFTPFDPGGQVTGTLGTNINNLGEISGTYREPGKTVATGTHGFIRDAAGTFTRFDVPSLSSFSVAGINDAGTVTGFLTNSSGLSYAGFTRTREGAITQFTIGTTTTNPLAINNLGQVVGYLLGAPPGAGGGFIRNPDGGVIYLDDSSQTTLLTDLNDNGVGVGALYNRLGSTGVVRQADGSLTPLSIAGATNVLPTSINDSGYIVGRYDAGGPHFLRAPDGTVTDIEIVGGIPGAIHHVKEITGINNAGAISGFYDDTTGRHGFMAVPIPVPTGVEVLQAFEQVKTLFAGFAPFSLENIQNASAEQLDAFEEFRDQAATFNPNPAYQFTFNDVLTSASILLCVSAPGPGCITLAILPLVSDDLSPLMPYVSCALAYGGTNGQAFLSCLRLIKMGIEGAVSTFEVNPTFQLFDMTLSIEMPFLEVFDFEVGDEFLSSYPVFGSYDAYARFKIDDISGDGATRNVRITVSGFAEVTAVPEPVSFVSVVLGMLIVVQGMAHHGRRRRCLISLEIFSTKESAFCQTPT